MENFTGYLEYTDAQIGRVIDAVAASGELDNTIIIYIVGDNGASAEGGLEGTVNGIASLNGVQLGLPGLLAKYDQIGGPDTEPNSPVGWAWAVDTPFQWTKQVASHFGGTRNPMVCQLALAYCGQGRAALAVPPPHRRRPDDPRLRGHCAAAIGQRGDSEADRGRELRVDLRFRYRP
jgi:hypothetical protein